MRARPRGTNTARARPTWIRSRLDGGIPLRDRRRRHDGRCRVSRNPGSRHGRLDRSVRIGVARAVRADRPSRRRLWSGKEESSVFRGTPELGVDVHTGRRIVALDLDARTATDDAGAAHSYEKVLLATGGTPRRLPSGGDDDVVYYRTLDDYRRLRSRRRRRSAGRGDRRRLHRLRGRRGARVERLRGDHALPGRRHRRPPLPRGALAVRERLLPREGRRPFSPASSSRASARGSVTTKDGTTIEADAIVAGLGILPVDGPRGSRGPRGRRRHPRGRARSSGRS